MFRISQLHYSVILAAILLLLLAGCSKSENNAPENEVVEPTLKDLAIEASDDTIAIGESLSVQLTGKTETDEVQTVSDGVQWLSSHPEIASISEDGDVVGLVDGVATLIAVKDDEVKSVTIGVGSQSSPESAATMTLNPSPLEMKEKQNTSLIATLNNPDGTKQNISDQAVWLPIDATIISVDKGNVTSKKVGKSLLVVILNGVVAHTVVTVLPAEDSQSNNEIPGGTTVDNPPLITLNGNNLTTLIQGQPYEEMGATAYDEKDGNVNVVINGSVDINTTGTYSIFYTATDSTNNTSTVTRLVKVVVSRPFITTWKTDNPGISDSNQIQISITNNCYGTTDGYDYDIDWGDGQVDLNVKGDILHTYDVAGIYTVSINGEFPRIPFGYNTSTNCGSGHDNGKLLTIEQWGSIQWQSMKGAFANCRNVTGNAIDTPDLSRVNSTNEMFFRANAFNQDINNWDVSSVTDMSWMFYYTKTFNQPLDNWDVSSVKNMKGMFSNAIAFNQPLNNWDVSSVENMRAMFYRASTFNGDLSGWDISSVVSLEQMFMDADAFNQDLASWDVSSVKNMSQMFRNTSTFNQDLSNWDVSSVTNMSYMFDRSRVFNQELSSWNVSSVIRMRAMFSDSVFDKDLSNWDVSSVTDMEKMFFNSSFNQDISSWDVSAVTNMKGMFSRVSLSPANYDALLLGWSAQSLQNDVIFDGGNSKYSLSSQAARDTLTDAFGWTITDGGIAP